MLLVVDRGGGSPTSDDEPRPPHGGERAVGQRWHKFGGGEAGQLGLADNTAIAGEDTFGSSGTVDARDGALESIVLASGSVGGSGPATLLLSRVRPLTRNVGMMVGVTVSEMLSRGHTSLLIQATTLSVMVASAARLEMQLTRPSLLIVLSLISGRCGPRTTPTC